MKKELIEWGENELDLLLIESDPEKFEEMKEVVKCAGNIYGTILHNFSQEHLESATDILVHLLYHKPIRPITEKNANWVLLDGCTNIYRSNRYPELYKKLLEDDTPYYIDYNIVNAIDIQTKEKTNRPFITAVLFESYPITMPYTPKTIDVYIESFIDHGEDFLAVLYAEVEKNKILKIHRFFKSTEKTETYTEIDKKEYMQRRVTHESSL